MRNAVAVIIAVGLTAALGAPGARAADRSRITSFTLSPAESLAPHPRPSVETAALPAPEPPPPPVVVPPPPPLTLEQVLGRWTERDPAYCEREQYVLEWTPERMRILLDGRTIDAGAVRYTSDADALKVERLAADGEVVGYWRLAGIDDDHIEWVETAERRGTAIAVIANPNKLLLRCGASAAPAPGLMLRAQRWWAAFVDRLWTAEPARPAS